MSPRSSRAPWTLTAKASHRSVQSKKFTRFHQIQGVLLCRGQLPLFILAVVLKTLFFPSLVSQGHCQSRPKAKTLP